MRIFFGFSIIVACIFQSQASHAQLTVRVVDVGAGLCCVAKTCDSHYMIYDAGNYRDRGKTAMIAIESMIPPGSTIDLMVLSHRDADHIAAVPFICENYTVKEIWRDGFEANTATWRRSNDAIAEEVANDNCVDVNLQNVDVEPGYEVEVGNSLATFLCGFGDIPDSWHLPSGGENVNARSIVARLDYGDSSILFGGDTVGRHIGAPWNTIIAAEAVLVANAANVPIDVDVVVAPHHGADNGSSYPFIQATSPKYVIFSAGSHFHHPRFWAVNRYIASGVEIANIFRTDRGDNEGDPEWRVGTSSSGDSVGDDDVEVLLHESGNIEVSHVPQLGQVEVRVAIMNGVEKSTVVRPLSARISKWVDNDELWEETHDDLEDHTYPLKYTTQVRTACPKPTLRVAPCCRQRVRLFNFARRMRCR